MVYLNLPQQLRLPARLQVLQSLAPERVLLVQNHALAMWLAHKPAAATTTHRCTPILREHEMLKPLDQHHSHTRRLAINLHQRQKKNTK